MDILILGHLSGKPAHGYEIRKRVEDALGGTVQLYNNVLYRSLRQLEEAGAVTGELVPQDRGPARRVYSLTDQGTETLKALIVAFSPDDAKSEAEFNTRLAYFHLVSPTARVAILGQRLAVLQQILGHLEKVLPQVEVGSQTRPYASQLIRFLIERSRAEIRWVDSMLAAEGAKSLALASTP